MIQIRRTTRPAGLFASLLAVLLLAACANNPGGPQQLSGPPGAGMRPGGPGGPATPGSPQDFTVNVGDRVFFETDSSELTVQARATLDRQAIWLNQYGRYAITIEGHSDERGTREYNIALGARRAAAARSYLVQRGVPANRIQTTSFGKERPVAVCNDISCWSQNRRAVTTVSGG